jgi:putative FmdB family regulatory protein
MPAYEYHCAQCGRFTTMRAMSARNDPQLCPGCGISASRVLTAAAIAGMPAADRVARAINERAANEPKLSSKHGMGCASCSDARKSDSVRSAGSLKAFPGKRPWMISH